MFKIDGFRPPHESWGTKVEKGSGPMQNPILSAIMISLLDLIKPS